jgi:hypothetical protein
VSCVPNVASFFGLSILDCHFGFLSLCCTGQRLEKPEGAIKNGQSKETGNIGYTRHRTKVREN